MNPDHNLTEQEEAMLEERAGTGTTVATGIDDGSGASELEVIHDGHSTYVIPSGEYYECDPWKFDGFQTADAVLAQYLEAVNED